MKKIGIWSMLMLATLTLSVVVACGSDDDEANGVSNYTSDEIVKLLTGKWEISGKFCFTGELISTEGWSITNPMDGKYQTYTGTVEFKADQTYQLVSSTVLFEMHGREMHLSYFIGNYYPYAILRKNGKTYIQFDRRYDFLIKSLNKTSFELVLDDNEELYMTMTSK